MNDSIERKSLRSVYLLAVENFDNFLYPVLRTISVFSPPKLKPNFSFTYNWWPMITISKINVLKIKFIWNYVINWASINLTKASNFIWNAVTLTIIAPSFLGPQSTSRLKFPWEKGVAGLVRLWFSCRRQRPSSDGGDRMRCRGTLLPDFALPRSVDHIWRWAPIAAVFGTFVCVDRNYIIKRKIGRGCIWDTENSRHSHRFAMLFLDRNNFCLFFNKMKFTKSPQAQWGGNKEIARKKTEWASAKSKWWAGGWTGFPAKFYVT